MRALFVCAVVPPLLPRCATDIPGRDGLGPAPFPNSVAPVQPYLKPGDGPIVLVLAPTRELAMQIKEEYVTRA